MKKLGFSFLFPLLALIISVYGLSLQFFNFPPFGKLASPFTGIVQCENEQALYDPLVAINAEGLSGPVHVFFDERRVPHIYASNNADLYFAQGYVTAYLRLWQMDFLSYAAAGRLSEIFGDRSLDYDRSQRRMGIVTAAKASLALMAQHEATSEAITSYTAGVNAYIRTLTYKTLPLEYKFLDYEPEPWTTLKSVLLMKSMGNTLSGYEEDYNNTNLMLALGEEQFNQLFPEYHRYCAPVIDTDSLHPNPDLQHTRKPAYLDYSFLATGAAGHASGYNPRLGSNSWVVSGKKTQSGRPMLCSDPHLGLTMPAIWLEMQLTAPGVNVYGVSIPGTPAVIIGFNEHVAWGLTNGQDDVKDWYKLRVTDNYSAYELDGKWLPLDRRIEEIRIKGRKPVLDTIYESIQGPLVSDKSFPGSRPELLNHALRWQLHQAADEFLTFIRLNRAKNYADFNEAVRSYACPVQNFTFISRDNDIAFKHQGRLALKQNGQGRFILDGTQSMYIPYKYIPDDSLPSILNPSSGFIVSANQHPTNTAYPYYYNGYFNEKRANRIRQLLQHNSRLNIRDMMAIQLDNTNAFAALVVPLLLKQVDTTALTAAQRHAFHLLGTWQGRYDAEDKSAKLFELWWQHIKSDTWDEFKAYSFYTKLPEDYVLMELIDTDSMNLYFDRQGTTSRETAGDIIRNAYVAAFAENEQLKQQGKVSWADHNHVFLMHMTNIGAFSRVHLPAAGCPDAINATSHSWGPSWRMIVEMGDWPVAYGIYPGGQSGRVRGRFYGNFVDDWSKGRYYPLKLYRSMKEAGESAVSTWVFQQ